MTTVLINTAIATGAALTGACILGKCMDRKDLLKLYAGAAAITIVAVAGITAFGAAFAAIYFCALAGAISCAQPNSLYFKESIIFGALFGAAVGAFIAFAMPAPVGYAIVNNQIVPVFPIN